MLQLTLEQRNLFKSQAHGLDPVVMIGQAGLTDSVLNEISRNLDAHGLIKIRVFGDDKDTRVKYYETICSTLGAAPVKHIGKLLVIYRPEKEKEKKAGTGKNVRTVKIIKTVDGTARNRVQKLEVKAHERVTQGGKIKRKKIRQMSLKKREKA